MKRFGASLDSGVSSWKVLLTALNSRESVVSGLLSLFCAQIKEPLEVERSFPQIYLEAQKAYSAYSSKKKKKKISELGELV